MHVADKEACGVLRRQTLSVCLSNSEYFWPNALPTNMGKVNVVTNHISLSDIVLHFYISALLIGMNRQLKTSVS